MSRPSMTDGLNTTGISTLGKHSSSQASLLGIGGAVTIQGLCALYLIRHLQQPAPWDVQFLELLHQQATPWLDRLALWLTPLGTRWGTFPLFIMGLLSLANQRQWRKLLYWMSAIGGTTVIATLLKVIWHRARPSLWPSLLAPDHYPADWAFPSTHAAASLSLVLALGTLYSSQQLLDRPYGRVWRWLIAGLGGGFVLIIAWTRLYLGVHFPSDIIGGWSIAYLITQVANRLILSPMDPVQRPSTPSSLLTRR